MSVPYSSENSIEAMRRTYGDPNTSEKGMPIIFKLTPREDGNGYDLDAFRDFASMAHPIEDYEAAVRNRTASTSMPVGNFTTQFVGRDGARKYPATDAVVSALTDDKRTTTFADADGSIYGTASVLLRDAKAKTSDRVYFSIDAATARKNDYVERKIKSPEDLKARFEQNSEIIDQMREAKKATRDAIKADRDDRAAWANANIKDDEAASKAEAKAKKPQRSENLEKRGGYDEGFYAQSSAAVIDGHVAGVDGAKKMSVIGVLRHVKNGEGYVETIDANRLVNENAPAAALQATFVSEADAQAIAKKAASFTKDDKIYFAGSALVREGQNATRSENRTGYGRVAYEVDIDSLGRDRAMTMHMKENGLTDENLADIHSENVMARDRALEAAYTNYQNESQVAAGVDANVDATDVHEVEQENAQAQAPAASINEDVPF